MQSDDDKTRTYVPLTKGTMVSHYRIVEKIGAGGMGEVYLAEDANLNRKVALKFLPLHLCQDPDCRARFKREAQAAAKLSHPNIVTIHEVSEFQGRPFFAMEHVEGQTLRELGKDIELPLRRIIDLAIQVCDGLAKAHSSGIVHRDIKPSNILIDQGGRARIVDFGLASVQGSDRLTKTGSTLGTVGYMSPEQIHGEDVDARSDLFSFGVVLYELITGRAPFKAESEIGTIKNVIEAVPEPLARYKAGVPDELQRILDKALCKDKGLRYQHADELAADLKRLISTVTTAPAPSKRSRRLVVPSILVLGLMIAVLVFEPWQMVITPSNEAKATTKRIVVVPFRNQTGNLSLDAVGRMAADWTTQGILQAGFAEVIPPERLSEFQEKLSVPSIVRATRATTIVVGSYYQFGDTVQFHVQVVDANEKLLQAIDPIKIPVSQTMAGIQSVREQVLGALALIFDERLQKPIMQVSKAPKYESYQEYIQGLDLFNLEEDYGDAIEHFRRAHAIDTSFVLPLLVACAAYVNLTQWPEADSLAKLLDHHRAQLNKAQLLALDELGGIISGDWLRALNASREEVKLTPGSPSNYMAWALAAFKLNRPRECIDALSEIDVQDTAVDRRSFYWDILTAAHHKLGQQEAELAIAEECQRRNPSSLIALKCKIRAFAGTGQVEKVTHLVAEGFTLPNQPGIPEGPLTIAALELRAHGYEAEAMKMLQQLIELYEAKPTEEIRPNLYRYGFALYQARRWTEARNAFEELVKLRPDVIEFQYHLGLIAARLGNREEAAKISDSLKNLQRPYLFGGHTYCRAGIAAILGEREQAVALLQESFRQGHDYELHIDFDFESLRSYLPFIELMKPKG